MIGALLDRMTQATGRSRPRWRTHGERLATGTQEIAKQLEVMAASAKHPRHRSVGGSRFANEAQTLRTHADALKKKVRGILLAMGGLEEEVASCAMPSMPKRAA